MTITLIRTIFVYFFTILSLRILGKRQIGEIEPSELVVTIIISEVAAAPIQDSSLPLLPNLIAVALLLILEVILSYSAYKSLAIRKIFYGTPSIFFHKGEINQKEMERQRFNLNDLMETIRNTGAVSLSEVEYVIMETNGNVSVIPKAESDSDNNQQSTNRQPSLSYIVIDNGNINTNNLKRLGFDEHWLKKQLKKYNISNAASVFCMTSDENGNTLIFPMAKKGKR